VNSKGLFPAGEELAPDPIGAADKRKRASKARQDHVAAGQDLQPTPRPAPATPAAGLSSQDLAAVAELASRAGGIDKLPELLAALKRIAATFGGVTVRGEAMLTEDGIEGGVIYALSRPLRDAIDADGSATLMLDLRPDLDAGTLASRLGGHGQSLANALRKGGLSPAAAGLVREWTRERPEELAGILWYRLPVAGDRLNWPMPTRMGREFRSIMVPPRVRQGVCGLAMITQENWIGKAAAHLSYDSHSAPY